MKCYRPNLFPPQCFIQHKLVTLCYSARVRVLEAQEKRKVRKRKNECFVQNTSWVSKNMFFRFLAPNPGNLGPLFFCSRSSQREPTIKSCMVSKVGWLPLATRATNLRSLVKSVKSKRPKKNKEIRFGLKPTHFFYEHLIYTIYIYINSMEIPLSPNIPTGGLAPNHELYVHCSNNDQKTNHAPLQCPQIITLRNPNCNLSSALPTRSEPCCSQPFGNSNCQRP